MNIDIFNTDKKYQVIYADPAWSFSSKKVGGTMKSGAANKYDVMSVKEMGLLPVKELAGDNCLLIMWWVGSQPYEALKLMEDWGFRIANMNGFVWNKLTVKMLPFFGMGFYTRAGSESALIGVKGAATPLIDNHGVRAVRSAVVGKHSAKPHAFYDDIDKLCGNVPKVELFARNTREGWDSWGNEL